MKQFNEVRRGTDAEVFDLNVQTPTNATSLQTKLELVASNVKISNKGSGRSEYVQNR